MIKNILFLLAFIPAFAMASSFIECEVKGEVVSSPGSSELSGEEHTVFSLQVISVKDVGSYTVEDCNRLSSGIHEVGFKKDQDHEQLSHLTIGNIVTVKYSYVGWVYRDSPHKHGATERWELVGYD